MPDMVETKKPVFIELPGITRIMQERIRQMTTKGWTAEHDDSLVLDELTIMAVDYTISSQRTVEERIRCLEKAGALIAAELDRLLRAEAPGVVSGVVAGTDCKPGEGE